MEVCLLDGFLSSSSSHSDNGLSYNVQIVKGQPEKKRGPCLLDHLIAAAVKPRAEILEPFWVVRRETAGTAFDPFPIVPLLQ